MDAHIASAGPPPLETGAVFFNIASEEDGTVANDGVEEVDVNTARMVGQGKFSVGQIVRHRLYAFRGVIFDVDPVFNNTDEWYNSIPAERRPSKDQPFYHLLAQNANGGPYEAYVSEQNLLPDGENGPVTHPTIDVMFERFAGDRYVIRPSRRQ
jgi:heat shock protein HspQ